MEIEDMDEFADYDEEDGTEVWYPIFKTAVYLVSLYNLLNEEMVADCWKLLTGFDCVLDWIIFQIYGLIFH